MTQEKDAVISLRMKAELKEAVERAAERSHLSVPDWIRAVLARAANEGAFAPRPQRKSRQKRS